MKPPQQQRQPPRASFDDDRDLDHLEQMQQQQQQQRRKLSSTLLTVDHGGEHQDDQNDHFNETSFEDDDEEEALVEVEKRWFAFEIRDCPPSLKFLVRFFRFFLFSFSGIVFTSTTTTTTTTSTSNQKFAAAAKFIAHVKSSHRKVSDSSASNNHNNHNNNHHLSNFGNNLQLPHFPTEVSRRQSSITSVRSTTTTPTTFQFNRSLLSKLISFLTLFANSCILLTFLVPIFLGPMEVRREAQTFFKMQDNVREALSNIVFRSKNLTAPGLEFHLHEFFGKDVDEEYWEEFMHLKPILRNLTKSAVYIFMIDALCQFVFNLILGGSLVSRISRLPGLREVGDRDRKLAYQLLAGTFLIIGGFSLAGLLIFNQKQLKTLVELLLAQFRSSGGGVFEGGKKKVVVVDEEEVDKLVQTALIVCVHQYHYFILAMVSVLFVYTMITGRRILDSMRAEVTGGDGEEFDLTLSEDNFNTFKRQPPPTLTEAHLHDLKRRLTILAAHFSGIVSALALPITTVMLSNALLIIGSFCFLLIHKLKEDDYFVVFIFNLGAFAFCRLVLLCAWGNALTTGHRELVRAIYEAMADGGGGGDGEGDEGGSSAAAWTLPKWMAFLEIKRLATRFEVNIGGVYSVKQSAILTVLAFSLNYIVVLLQTETYAGQQQSTAVNNSESVVGLESWTDLGPAAATENSTM